MMVLVSLLSETVTSMGSQALARVVRGSTHRRHHRETTERGSCES
jgi:hypothetical protein